MRVWVGDECRFRRSYRRYTEHSTARGPSVHPALDAKGAQQLYCHSVVSMKRPLPAHLVSEQTAAHGPHAAHAALAQHRHLLRRRQVLVLRLMRLLPLPERLHDRWVFSTLKQSSHAHAGHPSGYRATSHSCCEEPSERRNVVFRCKYAEIVTVMVTRKAMSTS